MNRNSHIAPVADESGAPHDEPVTAPEFAQEEDWSDSFAADYEDDPASSRRSRGIEMAIPAFAILLVLAWTLFFAWVHEIALRDGISPAEGAQLIVDWAVPVLLVVTIWLLAMRLSRREAARFADAAQALSAESERLEDRLVTINRELSLAREFLTAQGRDLESFGRIAGDRLSTHADHLQSLIRDNGAQVEAIASVSSTALDNMDRLRSDLPVIANSARDVTNHIASAGRTAEDHLENLVLGFSRLNEFGGASERQVESLQTKIDAALTVYNEHTETFARLTEERFAALVESSADFRAKMDGHEVEALANIRRRADALAAELAAGHEAAKRSEDEIAALFRGRMASLRDEATNIALAVANGEDDAANSLHDRIDRLRAATADLAGEIAANEERAAKAAQNRLDGLKAEALEISGAIAGHEDDAVQALTTRIEALSAIAVDTTRAIANGEREATEAVRVRLAVLQDEAGNLAAAIARREEEASDTIRLRIEGLRDESAETARLIADGEDAAIAALHARLETMRKDSEALGETIARGEEAAFSGAKSRIAQLRDELGALEAIFDQRVVEFHQQLEHRRAAAEAHDTHEVERFNRRLGEFDARLAGQAEEQSALDRALAQQAEDLAVRLADLKNEMLGIADDGRHVRDELAHSIGSLTDNLSASRLALADADQTVSGLTDASVRLLELIQASVQHGKERLPEALEEAERRLEEMRTEGERLHAAIAAAGDRSESIAAVMSRAKKQGGETIAEFDAFHARLVARNREHIATLADLRAEFSTLASENAEVARAGQDQLSAAIAKLEAATRAAVETLGSETAQAISDIAARIGDETASAIEQAIKAQSAEPLQQLDAAIATATDSSREAALALRDQFAKIDELAGNLEARVAQARERAEEQVDNDFSRRVALITESLNSNAIDVAKALSNEVTDTAWASYLRGDRGIFTRRAVRLLDNAESRTVAEIYENDSDFREHVSRYVHDFEAMLRSLLSTRDGHALSVTLLSSDMGKLYVLLAQAIDRLRN